MKEWLKKDFLIRNKEKIPKKGGGIFDKRARKRLLGEARPYGGKEGSQVRSKANFWNRITSYISGALIDLELFIVFSPSEQVNEVINLETIEPIVKSYFLLNEFAEINNQKIRLAEYFVWSGFEYLRRLSNASRRDNELIDDAIVVSGELADKLELELRRQEDSL